MDRTPDGRQVTHGRDHRPIEAVAATRAATGGEQLDIVEPQPARRRLLAPDKPAKVGVTRHPG
jgi:hypothetical protein